MVKKTITKNLCMRILASWVLSMVILAFLVLATFVTQKLHAENSVEAEKGYIQLEKGMAYETPVYLNGEWEAFHLNEEAFDVREFESQFNKESVIFPIGSLVQSYENAAYRIRFQLPETRDQKLVLAIPTYSEEIDVYLNGVKQEMVQAEDTFLSAGVLKTVISLSSIKSGEKWQELVLMGNFAGNEVTLFQRPVLLGTAQNISMLTVFDSSAELFILGILMLVLVNGFVFMLFRPNHLLISMITVFDTIIMFRLFFSMNFAISLIKNVFPNFHISDAFCRSIELFFLMMAGIAGCILSSVLFDPEKKTPRWLTIPPPIVYGIFAIIFPMNMELFENFGSTVLVFLYIYTFIGVFWQVVICWCTREKKIYYGFQAMKTVYIGVLIFWDISFWTKYKDFSVLLYLYAIFFIMHVVVRLYDNNESYRHVEILNQSLEATVRDRTKELYDANRVLSELSVRDPLTKAFNRLYFEKAIEGALGESEKNGKSLYLCIFDLDFFKSINDTYGHVAGDEMLQKVTEIVVSTVGEDVTFARIGGEEFVLLYTGKAEEEVRESVSRVHRALEKNAKENPKYTTASFGVYAWQQGDTQKSLMKKTDAALYDAKNAGRNKIIFSKM